MQWVSQITTVSLMMALPALAGYGLDRVWGTDPWLLIVGAALGLLSSFVQLMKLAGVIRGRQSPP